uniref:J domain-containing protein n=1 Tax=Ciona savignyi TaxID=51511 RepID=H2Z525_CIOSA
MTPTNLGQRLGPQRVFLDEDVESMHLKFLSQHPTGNFTDAVFRFNNCVQYRGLLWAVKQDGFFSENKEKMINTAINVLLEKEGDQEKISDQELEAQFHALRRLVASKAGFCAFTQLPRFRESLGMKVIKALQRNSDAVTHAAIDTLSTLLSPMHDNYDLRQEQLNKASLLSSKKFLEALLKQFEDRVHPSMAIVKGAGLVMKAIIEEGDSETAAHMQELALAEPAGLLAKLDSDEEVPEGEQDLLHMRDNLKSAIDQSKQSQWRQLDRQLKQIERLVSKQANVLLTHWRDTIGIEQLSLFHSFTIDHAKPNLIWNHKTREELKTALENEMRAFHIDQELGRTTEIAWNHNEFEVTIKLFFHISIFVQYECLADEIKIGDYFLRLLLEEEFEEELAIKRSYEFFNDLYHRFLLTPKTAMKCMCLQAMAIVYGKCWEDIGPFNDTKYIVGMLERCSDRLERDRLILFVEKLIKHKRNVKEVMDANGVRILVDLLSLAHLHTTRAHVPTQRNVIEATAEMLAGAGEKEWYFGNKEKERLGPYSFHEMKDFWEDGTLTAKSRCWAQGMDGWRHVHTIPQLKWVLMASGQAVLNPTDLSIVILNILIRICEYYPSRLAYIILFFISKWLCYLDCFHRDANNAVIRPLPRVKRLLSEPICLPHCIQLLLTFDPILVEKVSILLLNVMLDNPSLSRIYLTGIFFFILMYTGSNVLPIGKFLQYLHLKQATRATEEASSDMLARSILGALFPEAMIHYLENYGAEKFSEIFLGEFDTPEAIWNSEMRRYMIEKIAAHIADFSPRLMSNVRAIYQYVPIPAISFPQLEEELFCNIYYLRHLCNETRFPDWEIKNPVSFLKDVLGAWKKEVEKKGPNMSYEEAYDTLRLPKDKAPFHESQIRKAYFRMAQKYHPDKNPEGRDIFEAVNKAYEFLCTKKRVVDGPDPHNLLLILKTQSILFRRFKEELAPYKYAGYPALIKTITMETGDENLFSKSEPLLPEATELAYHTVNCSALNAEELRRENGIEILQAALSRCVAMLSFSSKDDDVAVKVCTHVCRCYAVAAQFEECREKFMGDLRIVKDVCRILYFKNLPRLCSVATECVSAFAMDMALQTQLFKCGVLWHLLLYLFNYDFTLEEGGVTKSENTNQQEVANRLARLSIHALACLGGYLTPDTVNPLLHKSLCSLITPYLTKLIGQGKYAEEPKIFCQKLLDYLLKTSETKILSEENLKYGQFCLQALSNVIKNNPGHEVECIGHFQLLFGLLNPKYQADVQLMALEVLTVVTSNNMCVENIADCRVCTLLLLTLRGLSSAGATNVLNILHALASNGKVVKELLQQGAVLYLLNVFCNSTNPNLRQLTAELFSKLSADKLTGPKIRIHLSKFLPSIFVDAMQSSPEASVHMFEGNHENPELIWNDQTRETVCSTVKQITIDLYKEQTLKPTTPWNLPGNFSPVYQGADADELEVGGVYLRLFISQPGWVLRKPREFTVEIMNKFTKIISSPKLQGEILETVTQAVCSLFAMQPTLAEHIPSLGHLPIVFKHMTNKNDAIPNACISVIHVLSDNESCVQGFAETDCMKPLIAAMKMRPDKVGLACEALHRMFSKNISPQLMVQVVQSGLVAYLLQLLDDSGLQNNKGSSSKAQIVKSLKAMTTSLEYGEQIQEELNKSKTWAAYKDQMHDLFISNTSVAGYLTGGPAVAGYLTAAPTHSMPQSPPSVDD